MSTGEVVDVELVDVVDVAVSVAFVVASLADMPPLPVGVSVLAMVALPSVTGELPCVVPPPLLLPVAPSLSVVVEGVLLQATTNAERSRRVGRIGPPYTVGRIGPSRSTMRGRAHRAAPRLPSARE